MHQKNTQSLLDSELEDNKHDSIRTQKHNKRCQILVLLLLITLSVVIAVVTTLINHAPAKYNGQPQKIKIPLPQQDPLPIQLGTSRVIEVLFFSGNDNRSLQGFQTVTKQEVKWSTDPEGVVAVDPYGRLETVKLGNTTIKVESISSPGVSDSKNIEVVQRVKETPVAKGGRVVDFKGKAATTNFVMQKLVDHRLDRQQAIRSEDVPESIKRVIRGLAEPKDVILQDNIVWQIERYADGSERSYLLRSNNSAEQGSRDRVMTLMGSRYLPGDGTQVISIEDDGEMGVWTVNSQGQVTHIGMKSLTYAAKANLLLQQTEQKVIRLGLAADARWNGKKWVPSISDNDGLWTAMFAAGELMRYASGKRLNWDKQEVEQARKVALRSLKATLMMYYVPGRNKVVDAKIHHRFNSYTSDAAFFRPEFLKKGMPYAVNNYPGSPAEGVGLYGPDAGTMHEDKVIGGSQRYTFEPIDSSHWSNNSEVDQPATTKRTLNGFKARTYTLTQLQSSPGGLSFRHNKNGTQTVISGANVLYDYDKTQTPTLDLGNSAIPQILLDLIKVNGIQYNKEDMTYKADTSSDETVGHLFLFKIAFDILDEKNDQQKKIKQLISEAMSGFCTGLVNNGYNMVDATGQGTKWWKMTRDTMNNDFDLNDAPLKSLQILGSFKLCYYVTGQKKWDTQYEHLVNHPSYRYLDIVSTFWDRLSWEAHNCDYSISKAKIQKINQQEKLDKEEIIRHIMYVWHYSDDEQAFLGFYTALQLETNPEYIKKYRKGMQGYWQSISRSQNPLWYYIYQLGYPQQPKKDHYGNSLVETASYQLSRHPTTAQTYSSLIEGGRRDVIIDGSGGNFQATANPHHILLKRKHISDAVWANRTTNYKVFSQYDPMNLYELKVLPHDQRSVHKFNANTLNIRNDDGNGVQASTTYTLPLWMGVYHRMLILNDK